MKSWIIALGLAGCVSLIGTAGLVGQFKGKSGSGEDKREINTSGSATVRVSPDSARLFFGIQTLASTIKEARSRNAAITKNVFAALEALQIPNLRMKTSNVDVRIVQSSGRHDRLPQILGYRVTHSFTVLIQNDDVERLGKDASRVLDTGLEAGANQVQQVVFFKQDLEPARREALIKAVRKARDNAEALAAGGDVKIIDIVRINGEPSYFQPYMMQNRMQTAGGFGGQGGISLVAGELEITCRVSVTCVY